MGWTIETLKEHFDTLLAERAARAEERYHTAQQSTAMALAAAEKATSKAEQAIEKRLEGVNEFRATLADQQRTLMPRAEVEVMLSGIRDRIEKLEAGRIGATSEQVGIKAGYLWAIGVVGVIATILVVTGIVLTSRGTP